MRLPDVNVLVYAHREDAPDHERYRQWLAEPVNGDQAFGMADLVLSGFLRVVTHPRIFNVPTPIENAIAFVEDLRGAAPRVSIAPGPRHFGIFLDLCRQVGARGNLVPDAWLAALAIESGCEWVTTDRDYSRFPGLVWRHPFQA